MTEIDEEQLSPPTAKKPFVVENIEPDDLIIQKLFPNMLREHVSRYQYAAEYARNHSFPNMDAGVSVLDIASARGYGSDLLKTEIPEGNIFGIEYNKDYIDQAHTKYPKPGFSQADARRLPFSDGSMHLVTAFEITEHLPEKDQPGFLREISRVLKDEGRAIVSTPEPYSRGIGANPYHLHEPSQPEMEEYFKQAGLEIVDRLGQIGVSPKQAERMKKLNQVIPIWPIFAWGPSRDVSVRNIPEGELALTHIYVLKK